MKITRTVFAIAALVPASFQTSSQRPAPPPERAPAPAIVEASRLKPSIKQGPEGFRSAVPRASGAEARARYREGKAEKR